MVDILILFHSQTGNTESWRKPWPEGVDRTAAASAHLKRATDTTAQDLKKCGALVICSPEYFGYMAGAVKDFFDRTYEELKDDGAVAQKAFQHNYQRG